MLDATHAAALRAVALGTAPDDAPALRNLAVAGLIQPGGGGWALTQGGQAVLELEGGAGTAGSGQVEDLKGRIRDWFMN